MKVLDEEILNTAVVDSVLPITTTFTKGIIECKNGVMLNTLDGASFPIKTTPTPDATWATNIVKKTIIEALKAFPVALVWNLTFSLNSLLESFARITEGIMEPYFYYRNFKFPFQVNLCTTSRGVGRFTENFLINYGINKTIAHKTAELLAHIVEYDTFYRVKLLDVMSEARQENFQNPRKEVQRLLQICYDREEIIPTYMRPKLKLLSRIAWILELPKLKRAFSKAMDPVTFNLFAIDQIDYYWLLQRSDYNYFGRTLDDRMEELKAKGWTLPTQYTNES